jgi:tetratricopeptide (TPR) repeat protein
MKRIIPFIVLSLLVMVVGCPDFPRLGPATVERAWGYYEDGEYDKAILEFEDVIDAEPDNAEAYNGLGWCYGIIGSLSTSIAYFDTALQVQSSLVDPYAGLTFSYSDIPDDANAIISATTLIQRDSLYFFGHDNDITWHDVRLVRAKSSCNLGDFASALADVRVLNSSFNCDVSTPEGRRALLQEIERLRGIV